MSLRPKQADSRELFNMAKHRSSVAQVVVQLSYPTFVTRKNGVCRSDGSDICRSASYFYASMLTAHR